LGWITCAKRPLTTTELQHALGVEVSEAELDEENLPHVGDIVSVCAGLVTIDEESGIIRLVHYTTQQYFERTQRRWFPDALTNITLICVTYLSFDVFRSGFCQSDNKFEERLRSNQLYSYAARNWGHHARKTLDLSQGVSLEKEDKVKFEVTSQAVVDFLIRTTKVEAASQALIVEERWSDIKGYSQGIPKQMTGLHLAAYFGIKVVVQLLLDQGADVKATDTRGETSLHVASRNGHYEVVQLLLNQGADHKAACMKGGTSLHVASGNGHREVVQLLLEKGADVEAKDNLHRTPLYLASGNGHREVIQLLLDQGANVKAANKGGETSLYVASENGNREVVQLLLDQGADVKVANISGWTLLHVASRNGRREVVQLLLDQGADVKVANISGWTSLHLASSNGHREVVQLLLKKGADVEAKDNFYRTPLYRASKNGHREVVQLLLDQGADVKAADTTGWTPLHLASGEGHGEVVQLLLHQGADVKAKDNFRRTPLFYAARNGTKATIKLLLAINRVDIDSVDYYNSTPLSIAARMGHGDIVALLLNRSQGLNMKDNFGHSPLWWARKTGNLSAADLLIEKYKQNGIIVQEDDWPTTTISVLADENSGWCDVCVLEKDTYYFCEVCSDGDFDMCKECFAMKAHCLDESHKLIREDSIA
jgi:ankyrin repeat protein